MPHYLQFVVNGVPIRMVALVPTSTPHAEDRKHAAIVLLHGAGGNVDFWINHLGPFLSQAGIAVYAPHYFERTSTVRADLATITDGIHVPQWLEVVDAAVTFVAAQPGIDPERVMLAGISLGAFLSLGFAARASAVPATDAERVRAIIEISGGLVEPYATQATPRFPPTLILHGATDNIVPVTYAHDLSAKLTNLGVSHRMEILQGEGHWFTAAALPRMLLAVSAFLESILRP